MSSGGARSLRPGQPGRHRGIAARRRWRTFLLALLLMLPLLGGGLGLAAWSTSTSTTSGAYVTADYDNKIVLTATNSWPYSFVGSGNKNTNLGEVDNTGNVNETYQLRVDYLTCTGSACPDAINVDVKACTAAWTTYTNCGSGRQASPQPVSVTMGPATPATYTSATIQSAYFTLPPTTGKMYLYARFAGGTGTNNYSFKLTVVSFPPTSGIDCSAQPSCGR